MKTTLFALLLLPTLSFAQGTKTFSAVVRAEKNVPVVTDVILTDLESESSFDGKYFKIVKGKSQEAIGFDEDKETLLRAATAYYHLTKARAYFVTKAKSAYAKALPKMVIRIDLANEFSALGHFANDNYKPQFNNALTVPAGAGRPDKGIAPWGMEIWFRPMKKVHLRDIETNDLAGREYQALMGKFRKQIHMQSLQRFIAQIVIASTTDGSVSSADALIRTAGSSLVMEVGYQALHPISRAFTRKWYWLDSALVPEIIYHEYAHAALSDHLELSHSSGVIEGMADYFAGQISDSPELAKHIKKYNTFNGKDAERKENYVLEYESGEYANTDFVFSLLWEAGKIVGEDREEAFMYELRTRVTTDSSIRGGLVEGILETCEKSCGSPFVDKLRILKALNLRGL
jgi:hypothetical protein